MQIQIIHALVGVFVLFLLVQATSGTRLREHANGRALVAVDNTQCTGDCTSAATTTRDAPLAKQKDAVPEFVPTHEWKDILPNQALPPGLYIRINMETGKKEAKLN